MILVSIKMIGTHCLFAICALLIGVSQAGKPTKKTFDWWPSISRLLASPCSTGSTSEPDGHAQIFEELFLVEVDRKPKDRDCLSLDRKLFKITTKEAEDVSSDLLHQKRTMRWVRGRRIKLAEKLRCTLATCVKHRRRKGLKEAEIKALEDLTQIASFAHYVNMSIPTLKGNKYRKVRDKMEHLVHKLMVVACKLSEALPAGLAGRSGSPVRGKGSKAHVVADDIPEDLRHSKKSASRTVLYVVLEKIDEFLRKLPDSYRRAGFKICSEKPSG